MKLYGAIDLHSTNNVTVVIDEQDERMGSGLGSCIRPSVALFASTFREFPKRRRVCLWLRFYDFNRVKLSVIV